MTDVIGTFTTYCAAKLAIIYAEKDNDSETSTSYMRLSLKLNPSSSFKLAECTEDCPWSIIIHGSE